MPKPPLDPEEALAGPLYVVAVLLIAMPAVDFLLSVGTPQPGSVQWRFATVGLLSGYTMTPVLGTALALVVSAVAGHALVQKVLVALCLTSAVGLVVLSAGFVLDTLQLRFTIPSDGQGAFRSAALRALLKHGLAAVAFWYLGWRARRMFPDHIAQKLARSTSSASK